MNFRTLNKHVRSCLTKGELDYKKVAALPEDVRTGIILKIVRHQGPILKAMMTPAIDRKWLASCGYLYETVGPETGHAFIHKGEHKIR